MSAGHAHLSVVYLSPRVQQRRRNDSIADRDRLRSLVRDGREKNTPTEFRKCAEIAVINSLSLSRTHYSSSARCAASARLVQRIVVHGLLLGAIKRPRFCGELGAS